MTGSLLVKLKTMQTRAVAWALVEVFFLVRHRQTVPRACDCFRKVGWIRISIFSNYHGVVSCLGFVWSHISYRMGADFPSAGDAGAVIYILLLLYMLLGGKRSLLHQF